MAFETTDLHPSLGGQYNLFPGLDFSPYVFVRTGLLLSLYRNQDFVNENGFRFAGIDFEPETQIQWTTAAGLALEYRLYERLIVGLEPSVTKAFGTGRNDVFFNVAVKLSALIGG